MKTENSKFDVRGIIQGQCMGMRSSGNDKLISEKNRMTLDGRTVRARLVS